MKRRHTFSLINHWWKTLACSRLTDKNSCNPNLQNTPAPSAVLPAAQLLAAPHPRHGSYTSPDPQTSPLLFIAGTVVSTPAPQPRPPLLIPDIVVTAADHRPAPRLLSSHSCWPQATHSQHSSYCSCPPAQPCTAHPLQGSYCSCPPAQPPAPLTTYAGHASALPQAARNFAPPTKISRNTESKSDIFAALVLRLGYFCSTYSWKSFVIHAKEITRMQARNLKWIT